MNIKNTITIKGKEYRVKNTIRAMFIFEQITKKSFRLETMLDNYVYFYSILLASNPDTPIEWDEFIDALDEDNSIYKQLNDILVRSSHIDELLNGTEDTKGGEKKN